MLVQGCLWCTGEAQGPDAVHELEVFDDDLNDFDWGDFDMRCQTGLEAAQVPSEMQVQNPLSSPSMLSGP